MAPEASASPAPLELTERQRIEAAVYDARIRASLGTLRDEDLQIDPITPPFPNREHVDFLSFALSRLPDTAGASVLEVGSGSGALSVYFAHRGARVTGIDVSEENARLSERRARANGVADRTRFEAVPIELFDDPDGSYDFIIGNQVLHHFELGVALPNILRLLRRGGRAVFCEPVLLIPDNLRQLRDTGLAKRVLPKRVDTPTERSVSISDLRLMQHVFPQFQVHPFQLTLRVQNFIELNDRWFKRLATLDRALLKRVPPLRQFCRFAVIEAGRGEAPGRKGSLA